MGNKSLVASALLMISPLAAQATENSYLFDSVSAVRIRSASTSITGILVGESSPTTVNAPTNTALTDRCEKLYSLVLSQPGAYLLEVTIDTSFLTIPPSTTPTQVITFVGCEASLKP